MTHPHLTTKAVASEISVPGSTHLYNAVRAAFVSDGDTLNAWCRRRGVSRQYVASVLLGKRDGPMARELRAYLADLSSGKAA